MHTYSPQSRISLFICLLLALPSALPLRAQQEEAPAIAIVPQDGFNMKIVDIVDLPEQMTIVTTLDPPVFNWFGGTLTNLPTDKEVTIGLNMTGMDTPPNKADVSKWVGLRPVFTYADPTRYETYEWFQKDEQGRWVSGDPFKTREAKFAGAGKVPEQNAIPANLAEQFLSEDGKYWQAWKEIEKTEVVTGVNIFRFKQIFMLPTATVAMRVPFSHTYLQTFIDRLQGANLPGVFIDELGITPGGRKMQIIRMEDPQDANNPELNRTVLALAREHATEPAGSWVIQGMLDTLLADSTEARALRRHRTWLFLPILDTDGSAEAAFDRLTETFKCQWDDTPPEVLTYSRYFADYIAEGNSLDLVVNLHNVEANESSHLMCPFINHGDEETTFTFNQQCFTALRTAGYLTSDPDRQPWDYGFNTFRLYGRLEMHYGALGLAYEVNDRFPDCRLSLARLRGIGPVMLEQLSAWCASPDGERRHRQNLDRLALFRRQRQVYLTEQQRDPVDRTPHELITLGY